jgi:predicted MFS family arabinose efflux permease
MLALHPLHEQQAAPRLTTALTLLLATGAGMSVASLYYSQPMLPAMGSALHAGQSSVGAVPMLTQLGYAFGILLLAPLGDRYDRRHIMIAKAVVLALALLASALAPTMPALLVASLVTGLAATLAQDFVPAAVTLAPSHKRGKVVGTVMTGLLLGILLSRMVSGVVAEVAGWRAMFGVAAAGVLALAAGVWLAIPSFAPTTRLGYRALLASMMHLWRTHRVLRRAAYAQGLLSVGFSAFWSVLAVMLHARFGLDSAVAGAFGLAGAAGALAAPLAGRLADQRGPRVVTLLGAGIAAVSFAAMAPMGLLSAPAQLALLVVSAIGFDFGVQASLVAHQSIVYGIDGSARSRLNAVLYTAIFLGMATGAFLGSLAFAAFAWPGIVALGTLSALAALVVRLVQC